MEPADVNGFIQLESHVQACTRLHTLTHACTRRYIPVPKFRFFSWKHRPTTILDCFASHECALLSPWIWLEFELQRRKKQKKEDPFYSCWNAQRRATRVKSAKETCRGREKKKKKKDNASTILMAKRTFLGDAAYHW